MPELSVDVLVANKFISSLSKSLQALCHGCMDFNSGIEIVGYINVNIDCGSKADYVLNEKVLKSTTNSMTFVSNSFLAKKDKPTRDGACSPIPQLSQSPMVSPHHHRTKEFPHSAFNRPHRGAHYAKGAHKRGPSGEWHGGTKRPRPGESTQYSSNLPGSNQQYQDSYLQQGQSVQPAVDQSMNSRVDAESALRSIKQEALESSEAQSSLNSSEDQSNIPGPSGDVNIKADPDGVAAKEDTEHNLNPVPEQSDNDNSELNGTFLQQPSSSGNTEDNSKPLESVDPHLANPTVGFGSPFPDPNMVSSEASHTAPSTSLNPEQTSESTFGPNEGPSEEASYSQYPDAGEGSSTGQFEVIEIDDEDEDMQAMFGASRSLKHTPNPLSGSGTSSDYDIVHGNLSTSSAYNLRMRKSLPNFGDVSKSFICPQCGKGYISITGLNLHIELHEGKSYPCLTPKCNATFSQKEQIRRHLRSKHFFNQCRYCNGIFTLGNEYNTHKTKCMSKTDTINVNNQTLSQSYVNPMARTHKKRKCQSYGTGSMSPRIKKYNCKFCPLRFQYCFERYNHASSNHNDEMPFICPQCGKGYTSIAGLNFHIELHEGKSYPCPICNATFSQKATIKRHLQNVHFSAQCPSCNGIFALGNEYITHMTKCLQ